MPGDSPCRNRDRSGDIPVLDQRQNFGYREDGHAPPRVSTTTPTHRPVLSSPDSMGVGCESAESHNFCHHRCGYRRPHSLEQLRVDVEQHSKRPHPDES
jgi:hypothetical protein